MTADVEQKPVCLAASINIKQQAQVDTEKITNSRLKAIQPTVDTKWGIFRNPEPVHNGC